MLGILFVEPSFYGTMTSATATVGCMDGPWESSIFQTEHILLWLKKRVQVKE